MFYFIIIICIDVCFLSFFLWIVQFFLSSSTSMMLIAFTINLIIVLLSYCLFSIPSFIFLGIWIFFFNSQMICNVVKAYELYRMVVGSRSSMLFAELDDCGHGNLHNHLTILWLYFLFFFPFYCWFTV